MRSMPIKIRMRYISQCQCLFQLDYTLELLEVMSCKFNKISLVHVRNSCLLCPKNMIVSCPVIQCISSISFVLR